ncbi:MULTISPECIES: tRNA (5-methylaminomethyl-2-thiouridine)(34)-methyltransferase MnmD [Chitinophagaceae]
MQNRKILLTEDGSPSIMVPSLNISYHNIHGAILESRIVYIHNGLQYLTDNKGSISIFEMGLGTGLNAMLSWELAKIQHKTIQYTAVECYPLEEHLWRSYLEYNCFSQTQKSFLERIHMAEWERCVQLDTCFSLTKRKVPLQDFSVNHKFNIVYFDAFDPVIQPDLWTEAVFNKIFNLLNNNGIMVTYCSKGLVRRLLEKIGFLVEKLPGPPGKREVIRARKG